jgi:hypothetical protein
MYTLIGRLALIAEKIYGKAEEVRKFLTLLPPDSEKLFRKLEAAISFLPNPPPKTSTLAWAFHLDYILPS